MSEPVSRTVFSGEHYDVVAYYDRDDLATPIDAQTVFHARVASLGSIMSEARVSGSDMEKAEALRLMVRAAWNLDPGKTGRATVSDICDAMDGELVSLLGGRESDPKE